MLEVPPKAYYFNLNKNSDGSSFFDFSQENNTRREFPAPLNLLSFTMGNIME
jgi:hypothetical protein